VEVESASFGAIVAVSGIEDLHVGDTLATLENPEPLPFTKISEPTISMAFCVNDSPFAGLEGKYITSRNIRDRLMRELNTNVSLRVADTSTTDMFTVSGRGELHLTVLIETMRREGYELAVSKPEVIYRDADGEKHEPIEIATIDVSDDYTGVVIEKLSMRKGELVNMFPSHNGQSRLMFKIPSRGLIGYRSDFLTDTRGTGVLNVEFFGYEPYKGDIQTRLQGSLIAFEDGESVTYGLHHAQERGELFIGAGVKVYAGMVIGKHARAGDMEVNVCKTKQKTNFRASGMDDALRLSPPIQMSLEQCLQFIEDDELLEVTPLSLRVRKKMLDSNARKRANAKK
jgi:GTP-binding protein